MRFSITTMYDPFCIGFVPMCARVLVLLALATSLG
ncbi:hypothetical protein BBOH_0825 [Bifidobacterium bohemicum DSM 22767]|uniref:Uncharacterized protein n=1 Tax=Bifidobacterium bohemicum DSM 22767 TaxID=1437606 RepID=A0A086ZHL8_9BIFI|nr:hypothetical protein BBOH_0825 [Bifidobacterium bohemicum DSM 22767]